VCLGHQAIGEAFGGRVVRAPHPVHGKTSPVEHDGSRLFGGLESPFAAARYHSLIVERCGLPDELVVTASTTRDDIVMGLRHRTYPIYGVQFHPESILTGPGRQLLRNFLR
jgi:anthranilate synthase/aminodeoxychorismate synthase-like glutamine amidotransferase